MTHQNTRTQSEHVSENHEARPQAPETGKFAKAVETAKTSAKTGLLAATVGFSNPAIADETSQPVQVADASGEVVVANLEGRSIDYDINSLSINDINAKIQNIDDKMAAIDAKEELTEADFIQLDELDAEKDLLQEQLVALEKSETVTNAEAISASKEALIEDFEEIKDAIDG